MADLGLIRGIAEGLRGGIEGYTAQRDYELKKAKDAEDRAQRKKEYSQSLFARGYQEDPEDPQKGLIKTKEALAKEQEESRLKELGYKEKAAEKGLLIEKDDQGRIVGFKRDPNYKKPKDPLLEEMQMARLDEMRRRKDEPKPQQAQAATFARRIEQAEKNFQDLESKGYNRASVKQGLLSAIAPGAFQPENLKLQEQAERNFINAVLRRESGAAIADSEFKNAEAQYFPRAGDTPEVIRQKAENRQSVLAGLQSEAGPALGLLRGKEESLQFANRGSGELRDMPQAMADRLPMPKTGEIKQGFRFKGGDPANPKSWERVK